MKSGRKQEKLFRQICGKFLFYETKKTPSIKTDWKLFKINKNSTEGNCFVVSNITLKRFIFLNESFIKERSQNTISDVLEISSKNDSACSKIEF